MLAVACVSLFLNFVEISHLGLKKIRFVFHRPAPAQLEPLGPPERSLPFLLNTPVQKGKGYRRLEEEKKDEVAHIYPLAEVGMEEGQFFSPQLEKEQKRSQGAVMPTAPPVEETIICDETRPSFVQVTETLSELPPEELLREGDEVDSLKAVLPEVLEERSEGESVEETYLISLEESLDIDLGELASREATEEKSVKESSLADTEPTQEEKFSGAEEEKEILEEFEEKEDNTFKVKELREEESLLDVVEEGTEIKASDEERELCEIEPFVNEDILEEVKTLDDEKIAGVLGEQESGALGEVVGSNLSDIAPVGDEVDLGKDKAQEDVEDTEGGEVQRDVVDSGVGGTLEDIANIGQGGALEDLVDAGRSCSLEDEMLGKDEVLENLNENIPLETAVSPDEEVLGKALGLSVDSEQVETLGKEEVLLEIEDPENMKGSREWDEKKEDSVEIGGPEKECSEESKALKAKEEVKDVPFVALELESTEETRSLSRLSKGSSRARSDDLTI